MRQSVAKQKNKLVYLCSECGNEFSKWAGRCPSCGEWNTLKEFKISNDSTSSTSSFSKYKSQQRSIPKRLHEITGEQTSRRLLNDKELNRVLGGGVVLGSLLLIGGEPGIGKSTLLLQCLLNTPEIRTLYVSGEESEKQIKLRAERVSENVPNDFFLYSETNLDNILSAAENTNPDIIIIDSVQTVFTPDVENSPGSISQIRECAIRLMSFAKTSEIPIFLVGHITKDGSIAGPKILEHLVDTVLQFEGDSNYHYRILRSIKNRFGNTSEIGIYEMRESGLRGVDNPSEHLITKRLDELSGIAIACAIEGMRPIMIEIQALVSSAVYGTPQRSSTGVDKRRMNMLLAVLEKRAGFKLMQKDVFINIAGGLNLSDPALDLAIVAAILSSNLDCSIPTNVCLTGEVGLSGEIRAISRMEQRISEAQKIGFKTILVPEQNMDSIDASQYKIKIFPVRRIDQAFKIIFSAVP